MAFNPSQVPYQLITLTGSIVLTWPFSFAGGLVVAGLNDVNPNQNGWTITLPNATLADNGQNIVFNNISAYSFQVLANDGITILATITTGQIKYLYLYDSSTSNGLWRAIPFGGGTNAITSLTAQSTDNSITITNGVVAPTSGTINFQLPTSISNLNSVATTGLPVITGKGPLTWGTTQLVGGSNITITNPDGIAGNPNISLNANVTGLTSIASGNITMTGSSIANNVTNGGLTLSSNGTGKLNLNGVTIDIYGNLTIPGVLNSIFMPVAWCVFTDTIQGNNHQIIISQQGNISSVSSNGSGAYIISFTIPMTGDEYGVLISMGSTGGTIPPVTHGFWTARNTNNVVITIVDASGVPVTAVPNGVTVMIMSTITI